MSSQGAGGWSPFGGGVPADWSDSRTVGSRPKKTWPLWTAIALEFVVIAALVVWLVLKYHHDANKHTSPSNNRALSHGSVESYIASTFAGKDVVCNDGKNIPLTQDGASFTCVDEAKAEYRVTITDAARGDYTVSRVK